MAQSVAHESYSTNPIFADGKTQQLPPAYTIARGSRNFPYSSSEEDAARAGRELANPFRSDDAAVQERGSDRFRTFCQHCHGPTGRGDGPDVDNFKDAWGQPIRPRDFTRGVFRGGDRPGDLWLRLANGIQGSPMPAYGSALTSDEIWRVVHYVQRLAGQR